MVFVPKSFNSGSFNVAHSIAPRLSQPQVPHYWKYIWWNSHSNMKRVFWNSENLDLKMSFWIFKGYNHKWQINFDFQKTFGGLSLLRFTSLPCIFSRGNRKLSFFRLLIFKMSASLKMSIILSRTVEKFAELPFENIWYFRGKAAAAIMLLPTKVWKSNSQHFAIIVVWTLKSAPRVEVKLGTRRELFWWNNKVWGNKIKLEIVQL